MTESSYLTGKTDMKNSFNFCLFFFIPEEAGLSSNLRQVTSAQQSHQLSSSSSSSASSSSRKSNSNFQTPNYRRLADAPISGLATANTHVIMERGYWFYWITPLFTLEIHPASIEEGKVSKITTGSHSQKQKVVWWLPGAGGRGK